MSRLQAGQLRNGELIPMEQEIFLLQNILTSSGAHSVPLQWVPGGPSPGVVGAVGK